MLLDYSVGTFFICQCVFLLKMGRGENKYKSVYGREGNLYVMYKYLNIMHVIPESVTTMRHNY